VEKSDEWASRLLEEIINVKLKTKEEFEIMFKTYMDNSGYSYETWDIGHEWKRYQANRSWFNSLEKEQADVASN